MTETPYVVRNAGAANRRPTTPGGGSRRTRRPLPAHHPPGFELPGVETATTPNPLGVKGIGEVGTTGASPAVRNAVIDALSHLGVRHIDMPTTPERVWSAIDQA